MVILLGRDDPRNNSQVEHLYLKTETGGRHTIASLILEGYLSKYKTQGSILISCPSRVALIQRQVQLVPILPAAWSCGERGSKSVFIPSDSLDALLQSPKGHVLATLKDFCFISMKILSVPRWVKYYTKTVFIYI